MADMTREEIEALVTQVADFGLPHHAADLDAALRQTLARNAELEAALRPFAFADEEYADVPDFATVHMLIMGGDEVGDVSLGAFRRARAALSPTTGAASEEERS